MVGETRPAGTPSRLLQYVLVPAGGDLAVMEEQAAAFHAALGGEVAVEVAGEVAVAPAPAPAPLAPAPAPSVKPLPAGPGACGQRRVAFLGSTLFHKVWSNLTSFGVVGGGGGVVGIVLGGARVFVVFPIAIYHHL